MVETKSLANGTVKKLVTALNDDEIQAGALSNGDLEGVLRYASHAYYNLSRPVMPDALFDALFSELRRRNPEHPFLSEVGAPVRRSRSDKRSPRTVRLPYPLFSLDKLRPTEEAVRTWVRRHAAPYVVSDKLDGVSALLVWTRSKAHRNVDVRMYSRGDGTEGSDLSRLIGLVVPLPLQKVSPLTDVDRVAIRGELILTKADFSLLSEQGDETRKKMVSARTMANSVVNSSRVDPVIAGKLTFVAYEIVSPRFAKSAQMDLLDATPLTTVWHTAAGAVSASDLARVLMERRRDSAYDIDGLVIEADGPHDLLPDTNPQYAFAFKKNVEEGVLTRVIDVEWQVSAHGKIKPRVRYEPVNINGYVLQYASGKNARFIVENGVGPGALIKVIHSGQVIPDIVQVVQPVEPALPKDVAYEWTDSGVDILVQNAASDSQVALRSIVRFFEAINADGMGPGTVAKLFHHGLQSVWAIVEASPERLHGIPGIQSAMAERLTRGVHTALAKTDMPTFLAALNCFGAGIGVRKVRCLLAAFPSLLDARTEPPSEGTVAGLAGFDRLTARQVIAGVPAAREAVRRLTELQPDAGALQTESGGDAGSELPLKGQVFVFTGFRDRALVERLQALGGTFDAGVTARTTVLVYNDRRSASAKLAKAEERGVRCVSLDELETTLPS